MVSNFFRVSSRILSRPLVLLVLAISFTLILVNDNGFAQTAKTDKTEKAERTDKSADKSAKPADPRNISEFQKKLETLIGHPVDSVTKLDYANLYEVRVGNDIVYSDPAADYFFVGNIIDMKTRINMTRARTDSFLEASLPKVKFADLPLKSAIKIVKGSGKRQVAIFADPNCRFCKRMEKDIDAVTDVTMYVFLYPVLGPDSTDKSKAIWCSANPAKIWNEWMVSGTAIPAAGNNSCANPLDQNVELGKKLKVDGTPTLFFLNGKRVPGAVDLEEFNKLLTANG